MRLNTQISLVPDGALTRVHVIAFDLEYSHDTTAVYQIAYDSGVPLPKGVVDIPLYLEAIAHQLRAKIALDRAQTAPERPPAGRPFLH